MAKSIVQPLTGKPLPPKSPTWPVTVARTSWRLFLLVVVAYAFGSAAMRRAGNDDLLPLIEMGVAGVSVICLGLSFSGIVGGFWYRPVRWSAWANSIVGFVLVGLIGTIGVTNYLAKRGVDVANAETLESFETTVEDLIKAKLPTEESTQKIAEAISDAQAKSTGAQQKALESFQAGFDSIRAAWTAFDAAWKSWEKTGVLENLPDKGAVTTRRKAVQQITASALEYQTKLKTVEAKWLGELTAGPARETLLRVFVREPIKATEDSLAHLKKVDAVLASLEESAGRWSVKKGKLLFKKPEDEKKHAGLLAKLTETPQAAAANAALQPIGAADAKQYVASYIALIQRQQFDEAYKYLPPDVRASVTAQQHALHWTKVGGEKIATIAVDSAVEGDGPTVGFQVQVPGKSPEVVVVLKTGDKVYSAPRTLLPK